MGYTAVFGGTFNPLHIGHYEILKALQNEPQIDEIFIMPDRLPPHKKCDFLADDDVRIKMCDIAAKDFSKAKVCLVEFEREGKSYSYDTMKILKAKYPEKSFAFVMGGDMLATFDLWYKYEELLSLVSFIAFKRSDTDNKIFDEKAEQFKKMGMKIKIMEAKIPDVASSRLRSDFKVAKKLIPEKIFEFLTEKGIYSE